jgi:long-chain acyl-CoA synthetase
MDRVLISTAEHYPNQQAVVCGDRSFTYKELNSAVNVYTDHISSKVQKGDRIGIYLPNSPEYITAYFSILRAGGIAVPINYLAHKRDVKRIVDDCSPNFIITDKVQDQKFEDIETDNIHRVESIADVAEIKSTYLTPRDSGEDDVAHIIYTSGTTGKPKGVALSKENLVTNAKSIVKYLNLTYEDSILASLPFTYSYGNSILTTHVMVGATIFIPKYSWTFAAKHVEEIEKYKVTGISGVPSTFALMLEYGNLEKRDLSNIRYVTQAGGHMPTIHAQKLQDIFKDAEIFIMYGQTEATARLSYLPPEDIIRKAGSIGKAISGVTLHICNDEIVACGNNIMKGYWNNPEETARVIKDGWLYTGDLGYMDTDGYFFLEGRRSDMIKSGGYRVHPIEIEEVILELDKIIDVAVRGVPDKVLGEAIAVFYIGRTDTVEVFKYCKKNLANYKMPKHVRQVTELPRTSSGKIKRHELNLDN